VTQYTDRVIQQFSTKGTVALEIIEDLHILLGELLREFSFHYFHVYQNYKNRLNPYQHQNTSKGRFLLPNNIVSITYYSEKIPITFHIVSYHNLITIDNNIGKCSTRHLLLSVVVLD
ncbi:unnamed protein product, partial [Rotaria magnacalcarata]